MKNIRRSFADPIALASLIVLGTCYMPAIASANPKLAEGPFLISRLLPKKTTYDCDSTGAITLTREDVNRDRFIYEAVNAKGQTLTITNGVGYGDGTSVIYTFVAKDGSEFILEEFPNGTATLSTSGKGGSNSTSFNCRVVSASKRR